MSLFLLQQLVLDFVVVSEKHHLSVNESLECMRLEAHVDKKNYVIQ